jgi:hypothetical protein
MRLPAALIRLACLAANMGFLIDTFIFWIVRTLKKWRRQTLEREALDWPRTPGTVLKTQARSDKGGSGWNVWSVELTYSYVASGEYYSGTHPLPPESEGEAEELAQRWKDRKLVVRYFPEDPSKSVVLMEDQAVDTTPAPKYP